MNIRKHILLIQFSGFIRLTALPLFIIISMHRLLLPILILIPVGLFVTPLLAWLVPVSCEGLGCTGCLEHTSERLSFLWVREIFRCKDCGAVFQEKVFDPDVEFTIDIG